MSSIAEETKLWWTVYQWRKGRCSLSVLIEMLEQRTAPFHVLRGLMWRQAGLGSIRVCDDIYTYIYVGTCSEFVGSARWRHLHNVSSEDSHRLEQAVLGNVPGFVAFAKKHSVPA